MKKALVLALLALICIVPAVAADNSVKVSGIPYAFQITTSSADGVDAVHSNYGFGLEASYKRDFSMGLFAEAGVGYGCFLLSGDRPAFNSILVFAGAGYSFDINDKLSLDAHADAGADLLIYDGLFSATFGLKVGLGGAYSLKENLDITFGLEGAFGFAKDSDANYTNFRVYPVVGVGYGF